MQYFSIPYENGFACELRTATFIRGKLFTQTHNTQILQSGPFPPRHGTDAECINPLTPNDDYSGRTTPLTSKHCILYIYSTHIGTECFKHGIYLSKERPT